MTGTLILDATAERPRRTRRGAGVVHVLRHDVSLAVALTWLLVLVATALFVQWIPIHDSTTTVGLPNLAPNRSSEFLGTDAIGRSNLSRAAFGARVSIVISVMSTLIAMTIGSFLGLVTAYFKGAVSEVVDVVTNTVLAVPALLLLLALVLALGPSLPTIIGAISLIFVPAFMRLTRANALSHLSRPYVIAARAMGASAGRVMFREVLPNAVLPIVSYAALVLPGIVVTEGSLSYLGFGVQPPTPSWGGMIAQGQPSLTYAPWPAIVPCIVLFMTVFSFNTLGDRLRGRFDVRDKKL